MGYLLGILQQDSDEFLQGSNNSDLDETKIIELINARNEARKNKDWTSADTARNTLTEMGIIIEDTPQGTTWKRK